MSSAIGNILEAIIDKRMESIVKLTEGQAGGKRGACTADHLFLLRGMMSIAIAKKQNLFITFYDVAKAYDQADIDNMMHVMWESGVRGKIWRIVRAFSTNQTAIIKTRYGPTRKIIRENGGRQGSRLTCRLFSRQMDILSEKFINEYDEKYKININLSIGCLEFVDDALTCTSGKSNQEAVLEKVDDFARMSKLEWGEAKCQVMQVGRKIEVPETWKLGDKNIQNTTSYKYLGDMISSDGKNKLLLQTRENRLMATTIQINTTASSDIMQRIGTKVTLDLYEKSVLTSFFYNVESWTLTKTEEKQIDKIGIQAIKRLFNLPITTPSAAIIYSFGVLYFSEVADMKKLLYFHKLLLRSDCQWTKLMLNELREQKLSWAICIDEKLKEYGLSSEWDVIKQKTKIQWKNEVTAAVEVHHWKKLKESCITPTPTGDHINTKTKSIYNRIQTAYTRKPLPELIRQNKQRTRTIILARYGMLECGTNFKGTIPENCRLCSVRDDENHRLNECKRWQERNRSLNPVKCDFNEN